MFDQVSDRETLMDIRKPSRKVLHRRGTMLLGELVASRRGSRAPTCNDLEGVLEPQKMLRVRVIKQS